MPKLKPLILYPFLVQKGTAPGKLLQLIVEKNLLSSKALNRYYFSQGMLLNLPEKEKKLLETSFFRTYPKR